MDFISTSTYTRHPARQDTGRWYARKWTASQASIPIPEIGMTEQALQDLQVSLGPDMLAFLPELVLCGTIVLMLLVRLFITAHVGWLALCLTGYAFFVSLYQWFGVSPYDPRAVDAASLELFSGMLAYDNFTVFLRLFLLGFTLLVIWLSLMTGIPDREDSADFFCLLLGATLGMSLMASANHLMMVFIGVEMASLPSYALAGFLKGRRQSSEAALKYVVYGGGAAGIMLYGISLIAGKFGTGYFPDLALFMAANPLDPLVLLGVLFILIGVAFKLAAVPFHFWCPDVFEGAAAEVAAFLSVASKGAALALLGRIALGLGGLAGLQPNYEAWRSVVPYLAPALAFFAALTVTFGNLAAYTQTNLKRLLAYSTIAHAGFMMMGLATLTRDGAAAVLFYLIAYLFMNLGAFAVVAFLRNLTGSEDLADFRGMIQRAPVLVITLAVFLLSLLGIPPLAGFAAKFQIFSVLFDSGRYYTELGDPRLVNVGYIMYTLLVIAGLNTVLSLFYYVKVLKVMILDKTLEEVENRPAAPLPVPGLPNLYAVLLSVFVVVAGVFWDPPAKALSLSAAADKGVNRFHHEPTAAQAHGLHADRGGRP
jgi:NADH-quinone oxidoreductase subunit N